MKPMLAGLALCAALLPASAQTVSQQYVMIGPFPDGRIVWCPGKQNDKGDLVIAPAAAGACRMDTSDVVAPLDECTASVCLTPDAHRKPRS